MVVRSTRINLNEDARVEAIDCLNENLANTLYAQLASKFAHWNVKGTGFLPAHQLFDKIYEFYASSADILGERITALGGTAEGLISSVMANSTIAYTATDEDNVEKHTSAMADMLGVVANNYRVAIELTEDPEVHDRATQDVFIELAREADKLLYF